MGLVINLTKHKFLFTILCALVFFTCTSQNQNPQKTQQTNRVVETCEGCELLYDYGNKILQAIDTIPGFAKSEDKLKITGTIYQKDGTTPAKDVILYIYQTNAKGVYEKIAKKEKPEEEHFRHRAWIKTDETGAYTFYTFLPGAYPGRDEPQHIHPLIKESGKEVYYIDEFVFDQDTLLSQAKRSKLKNRGGSGILKLEKEGEILLAKRNIILGLNIPDYE